MLDDVTIVGIDRPLATRDTHPNIAVRIVNPCSNRGLRGLETLARNDRSSIGMFTTLCVVKHVKTEGIQMKTVTPLVAGLCGSLILMPVLASDTGKTALGSAAGGAAGAAIGKQLGGDTGAMVGGAIGGGTGAAVATKDKKERTGAIVGGAAGGAAGAAAGKAMGGGTAGQAAGAAVGAGAGGALGKKLSE